MTMSARGMGGGEADIPTKKKIPDMIVVWSVRTPPHRTLSAAASLGVYDLTLEESKASCERGSYVCAPLWVFRQY